ncbi:ABC transporter transmembrane domain-containing protein [Nocardia sp. IFM 10818]
MSTAVMDQVPVVEESPPTKGSGLGVVLAPVRGRLAVAAGLQAVAALAGLAPYLAVVEIAREFLTGTTADRGAVWLWVMVAVAGFALRTACSGAAYTLGHIADADVGLRIRREMAARLGRVPLGWFTERSSGRVKRALSDDVAAVHHVVAHALNDLVAAVIFPVVTLVYLFLLDWRLALICLAPLALWFAINVFMMRDEEVQMRRWTAALDKVNAAVVEYVDGIAVVKAFGQAGRAQDRYRRAGDDLARFLSAWAGPMQRLEAVTQRGTHHTLLTEPGRYQDFWRERERARGWRLTG